MPMRAFDSHNHANCISEGIDAAEQHCAENGLHFTPIRRRVLEILLSEHVSLGAYEILEQLRAEGLGSQPPVVYRALDFLVTHGFAHRIERLSTFIACSHAAGQHAPAFLICRLCKRVVEAETDPTAGELGRAARHVGFVIERTVREAIGLCPGCIEGGSATREAHP